MLEWTGERYLPWMRDPSIAYEHLHRYAYAAQLVKDKRVLDLASGEGYGSKMLAETAASVVGVDIDEAAVRHATAKYPGKNLKFISGSITKVPIPGGHAFDVIVCFEAIEHIADHEELFLEVKRLLAPGGLFVASTPNKAVYHEEAEEENPFHRKELNFDEFRALLGRHFKHVSFLGQRIHVHSNIWPIESANNAVVREFVIERGASEEFDFVSNDKRVPLYFIALASDSPATAVDEGSVLVDHSNELLKDKDRAIRELVETKFSQTEALQWRERQLEDRERTIASLENAVAWHESQISDLRDGLDSQQKALQWLEAQVDELKKTIASNEEALAWRASQVEALEREKSQLQTTLQNTNRQLAQATEQLQAIHASTGWKFVLRVRHIRDAIFPPGSSRRRLFEKIMVLVRPRGGA